MESSGDTKSVKLPSFNGTQESFPMWWTRFEAYATVHKFEGAIMMTGPEPDMPSKASDVIDESTDDGKKKAAAKKRNAIAIASLSMAFTTEAMMRLIYKSKSTDWPGGLAHQVVKSLFKKFRPIDTVTKVELQQALGEVSMKQKEDPAVIFEQIGSIENRYSDGTTTISNEELMAVVLNAAPKEYKSVLTTEQRIKGNALTLDDLESAMTQLYRQMYPREGTNGRNDMDSEIALSAFNGICFKCNKRGHKASDCTSSGAGKGGGNRNPHKNKKCFGCGKMGHIAANCWEKESNASKRPSGWKSSKETGAVGVDTGGGGCEFLLAGLSFPSNAGILKDPNVWIGDTGATVHQTCHDIGLINSKKATESDSITMGNGSTESAVKMSDLKGTICDKHGREVSTATMTEVTYLKNGHFNLFSIPRMLKQGWKLGGDDEKIWLHKGAAKLVFDIKIPTPKGALYAMYFKRSTEAGLAATSAGTKMPLKMAHDLLGHYNEDMTRQAAKERGWIVTGTWTPCEDCAAGKAKQKNVPKESDPESKEKNESRMFLDISTIKQPKDGPRVSKPNWRIMVDERTNMKFSDFFATKNGMIEPTCVKLNRWKQAGLAVKIMRLDNAGENKKLKERCESADWKLDIKFEFTARDTPQQNHLAELGFAVLTNRGRAMMHRANVPERIRYKLVGEAFTTATLLDALVPITIDGVTKARVLHWCGKLPAYANHLRVWGEAGTVKTKTLATPKIADRGIPCMLVGYALDHAGDVYRMWNPKTGRVHVTRDIIWLRRMFFKKIEDPEEIIVAPDVVVDEAHKNVSEVQAGESGASQPDEESTTTSDDESVEVGESSGTRSGDSHMIGNENEDEIVEEESEDEDDDVIGAETTRSGRAVVPPTRLIEEYGAAGHDDYSIELLPAEQRYYDVMRESGEYAFVGAGLGGGFADTNELHVMKYKEAMATADRAKWEKAVEEEHKRMLKHKVWKPVSRDEVPKGAKILTSTWAMKKKANGTYRARANARGYEQEDGEHYDKLTKSAPVANEITIRMVLVLIVMAGWYASVVDVNGAFLTGELGPDVECYLEVPEGFEKYYPPNVVLLLLKTLYGMIQAAHQFWTTLVNALRHMLYERSKADPCLYYRWTSYGLVLWLSWVDDCLVCGRREGVEEAKKGLMERFDCDDLGEMTEYIGCKIERDKDSMRLTQPVLLQSFEDEFNLPSGKPTMTPAEPGKTLHSGDSEDMIDDTKQTKFRSGVGKLLHLMKWSRPDIQNSVRELSRFMSGATTAHVKAMYRAMNFCLATRHRGYTIKPNCKWDGDPNFKFVISGRSDADYAKDESRKSVSGYSTFLCGAAVSTKSKMQSTTTLSVTESELVSCVSCAQDMLFEMRVLESIQLKVELPMILKTDNKGVVDLANNWSAGGRTRHIAVRANFLRELKEQGLLRVEWIPTNDNSSDLFTKNLPGPLFNKHSGDYVS
jgi:hypothetical protein